jgi:hypothetical protein
MEPQGASLSSIFKSERSMPTTRACCYLIVPERNVGTQWAESANPAETPAKLGGLWVYLREL